MARPAHPPPSKPSPPGFLRRFARHEGGNIVEMALVSLPFITLLFGVLELGVIFMVQTTLENASYSVSRQIRTGELQTAGGTAATFKTAMCNEMGWLGATCATSLSVDVRTFTQFSNVTAPSPVTNGAVDPTKVTFTPGAAGDIVLVRCFYTWSLFTPVLSAGLQNLSGGKRMLTAAVTFRNEPFTVP
ncbi:MAG: pilus assembly protein [Caulobacter sp.]|nr:pilus assembly protein [Caulobacter sp.]